MDISPRYVVDLFTLSASPWGVETSWFGFGPELMAVVEIIGGDPGRLVPIGHAKSFCHHPVPESRLHLGDLLAECGDEFRSGSRSFATSSALWYPKLKSHPGTKKRWRGLPNAGLFKRVSSRLWSPCSSHQRPILDSSLFANTTPPHKGREDTLSSGSRNGGGHAIHE